jgi:large subunit ribosomal protein L23
MAEFRDILIRPVLTEKSCGKSVMGNDTYVFQVGLAVNKAQIKNAVEKVFDVEVDAVRTMIVRGKTKKFGRFFGKRSNWKKAYVKLKDGFAIDLYGESENGDA